MDKGGKVGGTSSSALSKCRNLTELEKSEVGLLQSRIEEQSHLIMILKSRADDEYHRRKSFEKIVDEMQFNSTDNEERLATETRKLSMLEEKFDILGMSVPLQNVLSSLTLNGFVSLDFFQIENK